MSIKITCEILLIGFVSFAAALPVNKFWGGNHQSWFYQPGQAPWDWQADQVGENVAWDLVNDVASYVNVGEIEKSGIIDDHSSGVRIVRPKGTDLCFAIKDAVGESLFEGLNFLNWNLTNGRQLLASYEGLTPDGSPIQDRSFLTERATKLCSGVPVYLA